MARQTTRWFRAQAIGHVERPGPDNAHPWAFFDPNVDAALEILPRWDGALDGIEEYSHLVVIVWLDQARRPRATRPIHPERRPELPEVGIFATRSPNRPNPIGISTPRLLRREGATLWVRGIDAWPGTPILDIKGYSPRDDLHLDATVPPWLEVLWAIHDAERGDIA